MSTDADVPAGNGLLPKLPPGWAWAKVAEVGEVKLGRQRSPEHHTGPHMRPYLRVANVFEDRIDLSDVLEMNFTPTEYETYKLRTGDVLLNEGQSIELVGRPALYRDELPGACFQNTLVRFRAGQAVEPKFALLVFRHYLHAKRFQRIARWTVNIAHLGAARFAEIEFPAPPLNEQRRIVEKVDELLSDLEAGVATLKRARANLKRYRAAVLKAAVEGELTADWRAAHPDAEPAEKLLDRILAERRRKWEADQLAKFKAAGKTPSKNWQDKYPEPARPTIKDLPELPARWCWAPMDHLISYLRNGYFQSPSGVTSGVRLLRINAVRPMLVNLDEYRLLPTSDDLAGYYIENGDLLFTRYNGSIDLLGVVGMVRGCTEPVVHPDKLIRVKTVQPDPMPNYLEVACNTGESRKHMAGRARTTAGQTGISGPDVREMPIPLPPLAEQAIIVSEVEQRLSVITATTEQIDRNLKRAVRLRQSILKEAVAGRLIPQDPCDEPASVMLERVRQSKVNPGSTGPGQRRGRLKPTSTPTLFNPDGRSP